MKYWNKHRKLTLLAVFITFLAIPLSLLELYKWVLVVGGLGLGIFIFAIAWNIWDVDVREK